MPPTASFMQRFLADAHENHRQHQHLPPPASFPYPIQHQQYPQPPQQPLLPQQQHPTAPPQFYAAPPAPPPRRSTLAAARATPEYMMLEVMLEQARRQGRELEFWGTLQGQLSRPAVPTSALAPVASAALLAPAPRVPAPPVSLPFTYQWSPAPQPFSMPVPPQHAQQQQPQALVQQPPPPRAPPSTTLPPQYSLLKQEQPPAPALAPWPHQYGGAGAGDQALLRHVPGLWARLSQAAGRPASSVWAAHGFCHGHLLKEPEDDGRRVGNYTRIERRARIHR